MVQKRTVQVDIAYLTYNDKRCCDTPVVVQDKPTLVNLSNLKSHHEEKRRKKDAGKMEAEEYHHHKWYNTMLKREISELSKDSTLKLIHWSIESGNTEAFMMGGVLYKAVSIIIGRDTEHWYCANTGANGSRVYGSRLRSDSGKQHDLNTKKIACFSIDDDEAIFVVKPLSEELSKCSEEVCANNCLECKKYRSPFTASESVTKCACFPSRDDFQSIVESDLDVDSESEEPDIAQVPSCAIGRRSGINQRFTLNAIREESFC